MTRKPRPRFLSLWAQHFLAAVGLVVFCISAMFWMGGAP